jgi:hypothetical protein
MPFDDRWLRDVLQAGQVRLLEGVAPVVPPPLTEAVFMQAVVRLARQHGWLCWHAYSARKSVPGYPDLTLAKAGQPVLFAELKVPGGHVTLQQQAWLDALTLADGKQVHVWVPDNWPLIEARLKG